MSTAFTCNKNELMQTSKHEEFFYSFIIVASIKLTNQPCRSLTHYMRTSVLSLVVELQHLQTHSNLKTSHESAAEIDVQMKQTRPQCNSCLNSQSESSCYKLYNH